MKFEVASWNEGPSSTGEQLVIRLLWNDEEISIPGLAVWCPIDTLLEKLHAGYLGKEHSTGVEEDSLSTLNSLDELDAVLNEVLSVGDSQEAQS